MEEAYHQESENVLLAVAAKVTLKDIVEEKQKTDQQAARDLGKSFDIPRDFINLQLGRAGQQFMKTACKTSLGCVQ